MIELKQSDRFAQGYHQQCFVHPGDRNLCIKIPLEGGETETRREVRYFRRLEERGISWNLLPRFYGCVETNLGTGNVFDLVRDCDGEISQPLDIYLARGPKETQLASLQEPLDCLRDYLLEQRIVTRTIKAKNILYNKVDPQDCRLVVIDNIGNTDLIPICDYSAYFAKRKIMRKWRRFQSDLGLPVSEPPGLGA